MRLAAAVIIIAPSYRDFFRRIGFAEETVFSDPAIKPWRMLKDRQNCTWDISIDGKMSRLHVKRFPAMRGPSPARVEAEGYRLLDERKIPSASVAAWGELEDGRSFIAIEDLAGFSPADKLVEQGLAFDRVLEKSAELASRLHAGGLHHRDLYLCHFMARPGPDAVELKLIDAARVRPLPGMLTRRRWIVKDLGQFWYSTLSLAISDAQRNEWLMAYCRVSGIESVDSLRKAIVRKSASIAAHDAKLRRREPMRNISIPGTL
jgi:hypothetical protein